MKASSGEQSPFLSINSFPVFSPLYAPEQKTQGSSQDSVIFSCEHVFILFIFTLVTHFQHTSEPGMSDIISVS